jgi:hypothetical protein
MVKMTEENQNWTKRAWIIERKFDEWNIRHKVDTKVTEEESLPEDDKAKLDELYQRYK